jgi:hypothetical protein
MGFQYRAMKYESKEAIVMDLRRAAAVCCFMVRWADGDLSFPGARAAHREGDVAKHWFAMPGSRVSYESADSREAILENARAAYLTAQAIEEGLEWRVEGDEPRSFELGLEGSDRAWPLAWNDDEGYGLLLVRQGGSSLIGVATIHAASLFDNSDSDEAGSERGELYVYNPSMNGNVNYDIIDFRFGSAQGSSGGRFDDKLLDECLEKSMAEFEEGGADLKIEWIAEARAMARSARESVEGDREDDKGGAGGEAWGSAGALDDLQIAAMMGYCSGVLEALCPKSSRVLLAPVAESADGMAFVGNVGSLVASLRELGQERAAELIESKVSQALSEAL